MVKDSFIEQTYVVGHIGIASMRQFQCVPITYVTVFASFKYLKMPISIKMPVTIPQLSLHLHGSYIIKSDFMNYIFNDLVVAWLYMVRFNPWQWV